MSIKVGDKVRFLSEVGGGIVTGFVNKDIANIIVVDNIFSDITIFDVGDADVD